MLFNSCKLQKESKDIGNIFYIESHPENPCIVVYRSSMNDKKLNSSVIPQNIGTHLSIDETALTHGELYTIITNKAAKGRKGSLVAIIAGTRSETIIPILEKIPLKKRKIVEEITLDMAGSMSLIAQKSFPNTVLVTDRFHVQKLAIEAVQEIRIKHRWEAILF